MGDGPLPVAIGGLGGSGTRVVASALRSAGYFMGKDLNGAEDNLWFTLLFKRPEILELTTAEVREWIRMYTERLQGALVIDDHIEQLVRTLASTPRPQHTAQWLHARADTFLSGVGQSWGRPWGWKEPNTHLIAEPLLEAKAELRYIHVTRNGLDMAYAGNQKQAQLWGGVFLGETYEPTPRYHLRYWRSATQRALRLNDRFGDRVLLIDYDELCREPQRGLERLFRFVRLSGVDPLVSATEVATPPSAGRWRDHGVENLDPGDVEFALQLSASGRRTS